MSAFTRMMEDYDYHKHTGELPEYFGGGNENNRGCGFGIFVAIVLFSAFLYATCGSDKKDNPKQQKTELVNHLFKFHLFLLILLQYRSLLLYRMTAGLFL